MSDTERPIRSDDPPIAEGHAPRDGSEVEPQESGGLPRRVAGVVVAIAVFVSVTVTSLPWSWPFKVAAIAAVLPPVRVVLVAVRPEVAHREDDASTWGLHFLLGLGGLGLGIWGLTDSGDPVLAGLSLALGVTLCGGTIKSILEHRRR